jgi:hypothetical protein
MDNNCSGLNLQIKTTVRQIKPRKTEREAILKSEIGKAYDQGILELNKEESVYEISNKKNRP